MASAASLNGVLGGLFQGLGALAAAPQPGDTGRHVSSGTASTFDPAFIGGLIQGLGRAVAGSTSNGPVRRQGNGAARRPGPYDQRGRSTSAPPVASSRGTQGPGFDPMPVITALLPGLANWSGGGGGVGGSGDGASRASTNADLMPALATLLPQLASLVAQRPQQPGQSGGCGEGGDARATMAIDMLTAVLPQLATAMSSEFCSPSTSAAIRTQLGALISQMRLVEPGATPNPNTAENVFQSLTPVLVGLLPLLLTFATLARGQSARLPQGASATTVSALPVRTLTAMDVQALREEHNACVICMTSFAEGDEQMTLPCLHKFHSACVDLWLHSSGFCPVCRHSIADNEPPSSS